MERPLKVRLHILSPVHIGCDDVYEPTGFVIDEEKRKLTAFDPLDFIKSLSPQDRQTFSAYCMQGNISSIVNIYKFMSRKQVNGREIDVASDLISHYTHVRNLPTNNEGKIRQELNKFSIYRTAYNPYNNMPYIPGTSIKGALRTAYLSRLAKDNGISGRRDRAKDLEIELLGGSFDKDPFRMMKVSDFLHVGNAKAKIVYAVNKKKRQSKFEARGPFQILESIMDGTIFEGFINLNKPERKADIKKPIEISELLNAVHHFYESIVNEESKVTNDINSGRIVANRINEQFKDKLGKTSFLLRIGRHSGAEAVTIEGNRNIKIMQAKGQQPKFLDHATTIWLASDTNTNKPANNSSLTPFGWAILEILPFDIKNIYPMSTIKDSVFLPEKDETLPRPEIKHTSPANTPQTILWANAPLIWNPGTMTLTTTKDKQKAEIKLAGNKDIIPEPFRKRLFEKRKAVTANVTVEAVGRNVFRIVKIEVP